MVKTLAKKSMVIASHNMAFYILSLCFGFLLKAYIGLYIVRRVLRSIYIGILKD